MKKLLAILTCFLLSICGVSAQSPMTDLQPVKTKVVTLSNGIVWIPNYIQGKTNPINWNFEDLLFSINASIKNEIKNYYGRGCIIIQGERINIGCRGRSDVSTTFVDGIRIINPIYLYQIKIFPTDTAFPRHLGQLGTSAAYSYDNKYVYKPTPWIN